MLIIQDKCMVCGGKLNGKVYTTANTFDILCEACYVEKESKGFDKIVLEELKEI